MYTYIRFSMRRGSWNMQGIPTFRLLNKKIKEHLSMLRMFCFVPLESTTLH